MVKKTEIAHTDILGQNIEIGSMVVTSRNSAGKKLIIAKVTALHPKMVDLRLLGSRWSFRMYPHDTLVIDNHENLAMYLLQNGKT